MCKNVGTKLMHRDINYNKYDIFIQFGIEHENLALGHLCTRKCLHFLIQYEFVKELGKENGF